MRGVPGPTARTSAAMKGRVASRVTPAPLTGSLASSGPAARAVVLCAGTLCDVFPATINEYKREMLPCPGGTGTRLSPWLTRGGALCARCS